MGIFWHKSEQPYWRASYLGRSEILQDLRGPSGRFRPLQKVKISHFLGNFSKFQNSLEQQIFVVQKRLVYEKVSIFDGECDEIKIKQFA